MLRYVLYRILWLVPVVIGVAFIIFTLLHITPGDPARITLGEDAPAEAIQQFRKSRGLDDPFVIQFSRYLFKGFLQGDFGRSYVTKKPVTTEVMSRFPLTLRLAFYAVLVGVIVGVPFGIICSIKQYSLFDSVTMVLALVGAAMPSFWMGILLILLFSVHLGWLPPSGFSTFNEMVMPVFTLSGGSLAIITRMTRSSMLEVIKADYIRTARAKGQSELKIIFKHALPNAIIPVITVVGIQFGALLGGAILTETVFSIPGVGRLMVESIKMRDYPIVQGGVLYIGIAYCFVNLAVDLVYAWIDPRIKAQYS